MRSAKSKTTKVRGACPDCKMTFACRKPMTDKDGRWLRTKAGKVRYREVGPRVGSKTPDHGWLSLFDTTTGFRKCTGVGQKLVAKVVTLPKK